MMPALVPLRAMTGAAGGTLDGEDEGSKYALGVTKESPYIKNQKGDTPAVAMGETLIRRLHDIGMPFVVEEGAISKVLRAAMAPPTAAKL